MDPTVDTGVFYRMATAVIGIDGQGVLRVFSAGAEDMFGYSANEVIGRNVSMLLPELHRPGLHNYLTTLATVDETEIVGSGTNLEALHADHSTFGVRVNIDRSFIDNDTVYVASIVYQRDHEDAYYWLDEFFNLSIDLLTVATFDGMFVRLNPAWQSTLGYPLADLIAQPFMTWVHPDDHDETTAVLGRLKRGHQVKGFENRYRTVDGRYIWLEWTAKPLVDRELVMATAHDVTRRHNSEMKLRAARDEATKVSRSKSEFLSRMSHELRTPLNSVIGFAQLLAMDDLDEDQQESVDAIRRSGQHLLDMINEVLDIARIEAGKLRLSLEPVNLATELSAALELIGPQAADQGISIPKSTGEHEVLVLTDRQRLMQILLNLLSNAIKYNRPGGSVSIEVQASAGTATIGVSDTGVGISSGKLSRLFEPFERLGAEGSSIEGTGVGLAVSKTLSQQMGGSLTVSSREGVGSTFVLELPLADSARSAAVPGPAKDAAPASGTGRPISVLYIEDNIANSQLMERALRTQGGISLNIAVQGSIGLDLATQLRPDLILLDLHLPDIPGEEVLQRIRSTPETADSVVVICSADASPRITQRLISSGANGYITKPIDFDLLFDVIRRVRSGISLDDPRFGH